MGNSSGKVDTKEADAKAASGGAEDEKWRISSRLSSSAQRITAAHLEMKIISIFSLLCIWRYIKEWQQLTE